MNYEPAYPVLQDGMACIVAATAAASVKETHILFSPIVVNHQLLRVLLDFALVYQLRERLN